MLKRVKEFLQRKAPKMSAPEEIDIRKLSIHRKAQRALKSKNVRRLVKEIGYMGYRPDKPMLITKNNEIICGQHRYEACLRLGVKTVWVCRLLNEEDEKTIIQLAVEDNDDGPMKNTIRERYHFKRMQGDPLACLLYELESSRESMLYDNIAIYEKNTSSKFSITAVISIVSAVLLGTYAGKPEALSKYIKEHYREDLMDQVNQFFKFFYGAFGQSREANPIPYDFNSIRAISKFYTDINDGKLLNGNVAKVAKKMSKFEFHGAFLQVRGIDEKANLLKTHFNKGKRNRKAQYT